MTPHPLPDRPFTTREAAALGWTGTALSHAVRDRVLVRPFTGVYLPVGLELTTLRRAQSARLVTSEHSVIRDRSAAWIHGIDVLDHRELDVPPPLETCVLRGHDPTDRRNCRGGTRDLLPEDWQVIGGVRVTTPLRTALDLACSLPRRRALGALDAFARHHDVTRADLGRLVVRYFRRRGVVQARGLIPLVDPRAESLSESWPRVDIADRGLPPPELQWWVCVDGVPTYRLDLAWPRARVAVEYDGEAWHSTPEQRARDDARRRWLRDQGWTVIVLTRDSFTPEAVDAWIDELARALGLR